MSGRLRWVVALVVVTAMIMAVGWFDRAVIGDAQKHASTTFSTWDIVLPRLFGMLVIGASAIVVVTVAWTLRSMPLGVALILVGGFFALLETLVLGLGASTNGAPPILPGWLEQPLTQLWQIEAGPLNGSMLLGATALVLGAAIVVVQAQRAGRRPGDIR